MGHFTRCLPVQESTEFNASYNATHLSVRRVANGSRHTNLFTTHTSDVANSSLIFFAIAIIRARDLYVRKISVVLLHKIFARRALSALRFNTSRAPATSRDLRHVDQSRARVRCDLRTARVLECDARDRHRRSLYSAPRAPPMTRGAPLARTWRGPAGLSGRNRRAEPQRPQAPRQRDNAMQRHTKNEYA